MPFPASSQIPADAYAQTKRDLVELRDKLTEAIGHMAANTVSINYVLGLFERIGGARSRVNAAKDVTGIRDYAAAQEDGVTAGQLAAEFTSVLDAMQAAMNAIAAGLPVDGNGYLLARQFEMDGVNATGGYATRSFTPAQSAPLRAQFQAVVDTIG